MRAFFILILFLFHGVLAMAQSTTDSLKQVLSKTKPDKHNFEQYLKLIQKLPTGEIGNATLIGDWIISNTNADSLLELKANTNLALGKSYTTIAQYEQGSFYLTSAQSIAEKNNFFATEAEALNALGSIYRGNEQYDRALEYFKKSLAISRKHNFQHGISRALYNIGSTQLIVNNYKPSRLKYAIGLMLEGLLIAKQLKDTTSIINQSRGIVGAYTTGKNYESALTMLNEIENVMKASGREFSMVSHYSQVARLYSEKRNYSKAIHYYELGLRLATQQQVPRWMCQYYTGMAETYENIGDYKQANKYNRLNIQMHDAMVSKENFAAAADIQNRYEKLKTDNEILRLDAENKRKSFMNSMLIYSFLTLVALLFLAYLNFRNRIKITKQKEEIQTQKIQQLEKDKQLVAVDSMLKGQEKERRRIAKDLHDGPGGLLSGTKISFMNLKEALNMSRGMKQQYDKSLAQMDNAIGDLRKISQNLMPEALLKYGLNEALRDFCDATQLLSTVKITYNQLGDVRILESTTEVFIYRMVQELVSNAIKHASASKILVQLAYNTHRTGITVEDNGKGFDKNILQNNKGAGMSNINYRVQYLNGTADIISSPGNGTSVNIELKV
jgi:two-component system, NarL family, sensor kinase